MSGGILVTLDGSLAAEGALPYAQLLARVQQRRLLLVRAVAATAGEGGNRAALLGAEAYLAAVAGRLMTGAAVEAIAFSGQPEEAILAEARLRQAGLIALAVDSHYPVPGALTAQAVLAAASVPTLFVPVSSGGSLSSLPVPLGRVLIPLDGSVFAEAALPVGIGLARSLGVGVLLLYSVAPAQATPRAPRPFDDGGRRVTLGATEGAAYLAAQQARLARQAPQLPVAIAVRQGPPGEQIVRAATDYGVLLAVSMRRAPS